MISALPAFAPRSADSCISLQLGGANASTCHQLLLLQSRSRAFCRRLGGAAVPLASSLINQKEIKLRRDQILRET